MTEQRVHINSEQPQEAIEQPQENLLLRMGRRAKKIWGNIWYQRFLTVLFVLALGSAIFAYVFVRDEISPNTVLEAYVQDYSNGDWEAMYETADAQAAGIPFSVWEEILSDGRTSVIDEYTYELDEQEKDIYYYKVTYRERGSEEEKYFDVALRKTEKTKYHFFHLFEVTAEPLAQEGITVSVPEGITFSLAGISQDDCNLSVIADQYIYLLPPMMKGNYRLELYGDTTATKVYDIVISGGDKHFTYTDFSISSELETCVIEHLGQVGIGILTEVMTDNSDGNAYGSIMTEAYGHNAMEEKAWDKLAANIEAYLTVETEDGVYQISELSIDDAAGSLSDFTFPDRCGVSLTLDCTYTAYRQTDILGSSEEEEDDITGSMKIVMSAEYELQDADTWNLIQCSCKAKTTVDETEEEES